MGGFGEASERTARGRATNVLSAFEHSRVQVNVSLLAFAMGDVALQRG